MRLFNNSLELVILDVDGVILDLTAHFQRNTECVARELGLPLEPFRQYLFDIRTGSTRSYASLMEGIKGIWPTISDTHARRFFKRFRKEERRNPYPPIAGSVEAIRWLRDRGIPLALCTTNERDTLEYRLKKVGIGPSWFSAVSAWENEYQKPDPRALDSIFKRVPVLRGHAAYVGDWYPDFYTARGAGVPFIAVLSGGIPKHGFLREGVPENHIVDRLSDLRKLVDENSWGEFGRGEESMNRIAAKARGLTYDRKRGVYVDEDGCLILDGFGQPLG